jgi:hypothetical protein
VGIFRGFQKGGLEFHADLILPYHNDFQSIPMHGQFLLIQLETINEAVLGRIASFSSRGKLSSSSGEEFSLRALRDNRSIPEDLREAYLKYKVNIRVLGVLRIPLSGKLIFVASHRRLPHVGSQVAFPSSAVLQEIVGHTIDGAAIGHFALGEYSYASGSDHYSHSIRMANTFGLMTKAVLDSVMFLRSRRSWWFSLQERDQVPFMTRSWQGVSNWIYAVSALLM